ncbi:MAG: alpha/beta hydrolase [Alphaproteobacteria bacterium]|nr:alpha/beta hydrolase [Alphaproteobacteria bacterium]
MNTIESPPDLATRFSPPENWRWHGFERKKGRYVRFGSAFPKDSIPDAVVVCLPGVREFSEKYFEVAHWCLDYNLAFWILDWVGQGKSTRLLKKNPQKRHSHGFKEDIKDLDYFIKEYIKHSSVHPDKGRIPRVMLGHSMGAHIGLHYLAENSEGFECACFDTPMLGLKVYEKIPQSLGLAAAFLYHIFAGSCYVPKGNNWGKRAEYANLTSDELHSTVENIWAKHIPELRCGDVTLRWIYEAQRSCMRLKNVCVHTPPQLPCLFAFSGKETLVDNSFAQKIVGYLPNAKIIDYPDNGHKIMMETDEIRDNFLEHFYNLIKETIIYRPETLKPF